MPLFSIKKSIKEFDELIKFHQSLKNLLEQARFISKRDYMDIYNVLIDINNTFNNLEKQDMLIDWCKKYKVDYKKLIKIRNEYNNINEIIKEHNDKYIERHLVEDKEYLDNVLKLDDPNINLDDEQRKVVLSDEDYTLVIAGAGAGKTTTIEAKVKYLVDKKNIDPSRILIVSFTKKATNELKERFVKLGIPAEIATFHSIGNSLIKENELVRHRIVESGFMFSTIKNYLTMKLDDEYFIKKILLFFASYLNMPFDSANTTLLYKSLSANNVTTLKSDIKDVIENYKREQTKVRRTINDESVRSIEECRIANFLFINGIEYEYEPIYPYGFRDTIKPYCPDFKIMQGNKIYYLEHFGISQDGHNSRYSEEELKLYKEHINDKVKLHRKHCTNLIYTFSKYNDGLDTITHLRMELERVGFVLNEKNDVEIYKKIVKNAEDKYFNKFITLVTNFISRFKVNNFTPSKFDEWKMSLKDERTKMFIDICYQCYLAYTRELKEQRAIDFEDMINNAANLLDKMIEEGGKLPYDYILVDEYQDISLQRFDLCEKLAKVSDAKIVAVGDDWQSIFRFTGSKIELFTRFEEKMGYANVLKITKTYRNSQELIDVAGSFVMENERQIRKDLQSNKKLDDPVILMSYNDSNDRELNEKGPFYNLGYAIEKSLDHIVSQYGLEKNVMLIGRYGFDGRNLSKLEDFFDYINGKVVSKKYPTLKISFMTAHSSKGLGADNVIIINGKDDILGFPSKIEDDPVMKLVIKDDESIDFAEERRLFYVALTRTKNRVYIITPQLKPSKFVLEIKDKFTNVILKGNNLTPIESKDYRRACPICGYPLQKRKNNSFKFMKNSTGLWICSNDPELCGFITNDIAGGKLAISKCPDCEDGYLIVKKIKGTERRMLGCSNYKSDGTGCSTTLDNSNFTQDKSKLSAMFYDDSMTLDKMIYMDYPVKELIYTIIDAIEEAEAINKNFKINPPKLRDFLLGKESKVVSIFKLNRIKGYSMINEKHNGKVFKLIDSLKKNDVLAIDKENYNSITILKRPSDEEIINIFTDLIG